MKFVFCTNTIESIWAAKSCTTTAYQWLSSGFTTLSKNFVVRCYQGTNIFCTRYDFTSTSSAWSPCSFSPLAGLPVSVFRKVRVKTMIAQYHSSLRLQRGLMKRTRVWVSVLGDSFIHKMSFEFLQPFGQFGKIRVSPFLVVVLNFDLVLGFWLGWKMGLTVLSRLHSHIQLMLEQGLSLYFPAVMMLEVLF